MKMMDELKPMFLYAANRKVYVPVDEKDRKKNSSILLLTPSLEVSSNLMNLPYLYNPGLFRSFYIDRNVMAYIDSTGVDNLDFDEQEEEALSESMFGFGSNKTKFIFDEDMGIMDRKYTQEVFNLKNASKYANILKISKMPEKINIIVHPNLRDLQKDAPKHINSLYSNRVYSFTVNNDIHVLSKLSYNEKSMGGPYQVYLENELIFALCSLYNDNLNFIPVKAISNVLSGQFDWKKKNDNTIPKVDNIEKFSSIISDMVNKKDYREISLYLKSGNLNIFKNYLSLSVIHGVNKVCRSLFESELSYFDRQRLPSSEFGIPKKRKYPMPDKDHVKLAIKMFNHCDSDEEEKELAENIIKRIKKFGMDDIKVGVGNRFYKYFKKAIEDKDIVMKESFIRSDYEDILKICSNLSQDEFKRISFYDTYKDSQFVIKRIIKYVNGEAAGFLDVYQFPTKPDIAQITIAVSNKYRGLGIANSMVKELISSNLHEKYGFKLYYWTAHMDNDASINLAEKNGFIDSGNIDRYGRKVFLYNTVQNDELKGIREEFKALYESSIESGDSSILFTEADNERAYSQKLKRYLYSERIRNNRAVLGLYDKIRETNPDIIKMYPKISMYKKFNLFVDLSYYNALFLKNNTYKLDKGVNFYFDFLNRLINNKDIDSEYKKKTIFIPVDQGIWPVQPMTDVFDFRKNLNPISVIFRLVRTNLSLLRREWGNKNIIFVGSRGYFKVDFNTIDVRSLNRFKINLRKLTSASEPVVDDFEVDEDEIQGIPDSGSTKAVTMGIIDKIENKGSIKINNTKPSTAINKSNSTNSNTSSIEIPDDHLEFSSSPLEFIKNENNDKENTLLFSLDTDLNIKDLDGLVLNHLENIERFCSLDKK